MSVQDWSTTPANNSTVDGINIAEGCAAGNLNGAIRAVMASVRVAFNGVPVATDFVPKAGGAFTGTVSRQGGGAFIYHADASNASGRIFTQVAGGSVPAGMANGDFLVEVA